jgi:hypothetical protein
VKRDVSEYAATSTPTSASGPGPASGLPSQHDDAPKKQGKPKRKLRRVESKTSASTELVEESEQDEEEDEEEEEEEEEPPGGAGAAATDPPDLQEEAEPEAATESLELEEAGSEKTKAASKTNRKVRISVVLARISLHYNVLVPGSQTSCPVCIRHVLGMY